MVHCLTPGHFHLIKNMIIGTANQNPRFLHTDIFNQLKILFIGTYPGCYFREFISALHTFIHRIAIFLAVKKKLTLPDYAIFPAKTVQIIKNGYDLLCRIRCAGLLPIAECRVRNPDFLRHIVWHNTVVKGNFRHLVIRKKVAEYMWFLHIDQLIYMLLKGKQVVMAVQINFAALHTNNPPLCIRSDFDRYVLVLLYTIIRVLSSTRTKFSLFR